MRFTNVIGVRSTESNEDHVCAFCQTAFDSRERVCPVCNAEIVLRGER